MTSNESVTQSIPPVGGGSGTPPPPDPTQVMPPQPSAPPGPPPRDSQVTRWLAATTHLQGSYAEQVADTLIDPTFTATAPSWGVDLVALARHATLANQRRHARERVLRRLLYATLLLALISVASWPYHWLSPFQATILTIAVVIVGWLAAWQVVFTHYDLVRVSSLEVMNTKVRVRDAAPALDDAEVERRLTSMATANVVVFGGYTPFVGDGQPLDSWTISFDLEAAEDWTGQRGEISAFTVHALYDHLIGHVPAALGDIPSGMRLYVNGTAAKNVPGLIPAPSDVQIRPACQLPWDVVETYIDAPTETARTYVWFSNSAWGGDIGVTLLLRAQLTGGRLFIEGRSHVLLPVQQVFRDVKFVPANPGRAWLVVARPTTAAVTPLWLGSVSRYLDRQHRIRQFMRRMKRLRRDLVDGVRPVNYGAAPSLREDAADAGELKYYATVDEVQRFLVMTRTVLDSCRTFLKGQQVDLTAFNTQADSVINQTSVRLHPIKGASGNFGKNSTVTVTEGIAGPG